MPAVFAANGACPAREAARTSRGVTPNSWRKARVKLDASAKHSASAILAMG